jgi:glycosyltransferase involved in cell wall biosynthesis
VSPRTAALVPAYEAAASIAAVVRGTLAVLPAVVVVDDGSADDTAARAAAAGAEVLRHPVNQGKGAALVTGLRHLATAGIERALTLDADGQHLPDQIAVLLEAPSSSASAARSASRSSARRVSATGSPTA